MAGTSQTPPSYSDKLDATLSKLLNGQHTIQQTQTAFQHDLHSLTTKVAFLESKLSHNPSPTNDSSSTGFVLPFQFTVLPHTMKLDVPKFDGFYSLGWSFKINQFFDFHHTPKDHRIRIASFYMEGEALSWFKWMSDNGQLMSWQIFIHALELCFTPSQFEDLRGTHVERSKMEENTHSTNGRRGATREQSEHSANGHCGTGTLRCGTWELFLSSFEDFQAKWTSGEFCHTRIRSSQPRRPFGIEFQAGSLEA
ncbi:hypothetical protein L6164_008502 [Bauhinia variegata]|uniref:Uncharacterized protein n=1 Tax=Bauhinia variegata TaxID=167791 RepID=A0ACB9PGW4_BAUVA|nr:hypothetical protein L6164_008502 [Bauhinia variegata]